MFGKFFCKFLQRIVITVLVIPEKICAQSETNELDSQFVKVLMVKICCVKIDLRLNNCTLKYEKLLKLYEKWGKQKIRSYYEFEPIEQTNEMRKFKIRHNLQVLITVWRKIDFEGVSLIVVVFWTSSSSVAAAAILLRTRLLNRRSKKLSIFSSEQKSVPGTLDRSFLGRCSNFFFESFVCSSAAAAETHFQTHVENTLQPNLSTEFSPSTSNG